VLLVLLLPLVLVLVLVPAVSPRCFSLDTSQLFGPFPPMLDFSRSRGRPIALSPPELLLMPPKLGRGLVLAWGFAWLPLPANTMYSSNGTGRSLVTNTVAPNHLPSESMFGIVALNPTI
jgi:hypothetical protein